MTPEPVSPPDSGAQVRAEKVDPARPPRVHFSGVNLLRAVAVITVVYSHISYYLVDDLHTRWWAIDAVSIGLVRYGGLNQHLSFVGVAVFMILTGLVATRSATVNSPGSFLVARIARLIPVFWVAVAIAIVLVRLGVNGMFSESDGIDNGQAALSFVLGGFFVTPEVVVLGVTWTLAVQTLFYLYCVAARGLLRTRPIVVPMVGAGLCLAVLVYTQFAPENWQIPMVDKIAATLPAVFVGQILYIARAGLAPWRSIVVAALAQAFVIRYATDLDAFHVGQRNHLWTILVLVAAVALFCQRDGVVARSRAVHWLATRSYAIYLLHTLILYRVYEHVEPLAGPTVAVLASALAIGVVSDLAYRWIEIPVARAITSRWSARVTTKKEKTRAVPEQGEIH